ncbi:hypothetical protein [Rhizobium mongolense]|uniref:Antitoxin Phd_YefM of type II toxin-antitoxin system n=2 Tax=Rhizobium mongolense TaxID=57676 RepID=A0ABR6ILL9_9HYPH|nr:hypothetical protein [Rhizobium mongolense]MBB4228513.1 hypothetical protein [Rhizobium mongolense]TVZ64353.1 hypothetical protein BCL32_4593 [Rhizobium mongolense USDA 1844]
MTKKSFVSQTEMRRMAEVANTEGVTIELEREGTIVRVMPFRPSRIVKPKVSREEEADASLAEWLERNGTER